MMLGSQKVRRSVRPRAVRVRMGVVCGALVIAVLALVGRAAQLQLSRGDDLRKMATQQHLRELSLMSFRGPIRDRNNVDLAVSVEVDSVYAHPAQMADKVHAAAQLAEALGSSPQAMQRLLSSNRPFVWIERRVTPRTAERVLALDLPGVGTLTESRRYYPQSELAAHVVGFAGLDGNGLEGLELAFDDVLRGERYKVASLRDAHGRHLYTDGRVPSADLRGGTLTLTLDRGIQYAAERELRRAVETFDAVAGSIIVLDVGTGAVLAMANQPAFNPNDLARFKPTQWRNRAVTDQYEPGSTLKPLVVAAAIDERLIASNDNIRCENGRWRVADRYIHDTHPHRVLSVTDVVAKSSNIGAAKIGTMLGPQTLHRYLARFGFGAPTDVDLPGEANGALLPSRRWGPVELATISFGQGISVTPLQLASSYAALANGGVLLRPYLVQELRNAAGETLHHGTPHFVRRVVSQETATIVTRMMEQVVKPGSTGWRAAVPGVRVAGKTGTSQKVDPQQGGYSKDKRVGSFVGFVPAEAPRLVIAVMIDEPTTVTYGGTVAAPAFAAVAQEALKRLGVIPKSSPEPASAPSTRAAIARGLDAESEGEAFALASPAATTNDHGKRTLPDLRGLSLREALLRLDPLGVEVSIDGYGRVSRQHPSAGQALSPGSDVRLALMPPSRVVGGGG